MVIFFLFIVLIMPITLIILGVVWLKNPPKSINNIHGYRTQWSMKSPKTWDFAHKYCAKLWLVIGFPLMLLSLSYLYLIKDYDIDRLGIHIIILTGIQILAFIFPMIPTEITLRKKFNKNGILK